MIDFRFHITDDFYVVWMAGMNRYLQLKEPAFYVFEQWAKDVDMQDIVKSCSLRYALPDLESKQFVEEIAGRVQLLFDEARGEAEVQHGEFLYAEPSDFFSEHYYLIGNHTFRFIYRNEYLKVLFHPLFLPLEIQPVPATSTCIELSTDGISDSFSVNGSEPHSFAFGEIDAFQGAVFMEILNTVHAKQLADWMGVIHASAVTNDTGAIIFTAPSGSGKSTIALLMMGSGFSILSDDFVPIAMHEPEVYQFPSAISVKTGAIEVIRGFVPELNKLLTSENNETEIYLSQPQTNAILANVKAKALVWVKYDPEVDYELKRMSNLEMMDSFIRQSWIAGTPEAAERFMSWYFGIPVFSLRYSDNAKAVEGMKLLFD